MFSNNIIIDSVLLEKGTNILGKDLGHFWLGYIRMLGHLQLSAHEPKNMFPFLLILAHNRVDSSCKPCNDKHDI